MTGTYARRIVGLLLGASLVFGLVPPSPADALTDDLAYAPPTGWTSTGSVLINGGCTSGGTGAIDDHDANTFTACTTNGGASNPRTATTMNFGRTSGVTSFTLGHVIVDMGTCSSGWPNYHTTCGSGNTITQVTGWCENSVPATLSTQVYDSGAISVAGRSTFEFDLDTPCTIDRSGSLAEQLTLRISTGGGSPDFAVFGYEVYATVGDVADYIFGLTCTNTLFSKTCGWLWMQSYTGTWQVARARTDPVVDNTVIASGSDPTANSVGDTCTTANGCTSFFTDPCGAQGCAGWIVSGEDTGANVTWSYAIAADANGTLIPMVPRMRISGVSGCYNADYEQCGSGLLATSIHVTFAILPSSEPDDVLVQIGSQYLFGPGFDGDPWYSDTVAGGVHTIDANVTSPYPVGGQKLLIVATGPHNSDSVLYSLDWVDGGSSAPVVRDDPDAPTVRDCDTLDVACVGSNLAILFGDALDRVMGGAADLWSTEVQGLYDLIGTKEPFASVNRAYAGISEQLAALTAEVGDEDDCAGLTISVPIVSVFGSLLPEDTPDDPSFTILDCQTFAPLLASSWFPPIRAAMDPAIYVFFAWRQLRQLQPRTQI